MGLAGRKQKQRIPADPRNLSWADDASRFGLAYLSKFGWDESKGLGSSGDGMKTYLKVQQKLDMMGIGAQHQRDPNGIAWKQNKEFEALLKRLNESTEKEKNDNGEDTEGEDNNVRETASDSAFVRAREEDIEKESVTTKKRKHEDGRGPDGTRKKPKKEKQQNERRKSSPDLDGSLSSPKPSSERIPKSRPMAHRARIRAAKRLAGKSASAIAEILGITPSSSVSTSPSHAPTPSPQPSISLDNLTTSTKSVTDYFKEKLLSRSSSTSSPASSLTPASSGSATSGLGVITSGPGWSPPDQVDEVPRRGIGSRAPVVPPSQIIEAEPASASNNKLTERLHRKAGRKAEKRRRDTKATQGALSEHKKGPL